MNLLFGARETFADNFTFESSSFFESKPLVVLSETSLALFVHHQYESDPHFRRSNNPASLVNVNCLFYFFSILMQFLLDGFDRPIRSRPKMNLSPMSSLLLKSMVKSVFCSGNTSI